MQAVVASDSVKKSTTAAEAQESLYVLSGMYFRADAKVPAALFAFQKGAGFAMSSNSVPPTATLNGVEAMPLTARPETAGCLEALPETKSQPAEPWSPLETRTVIPSAAACCHVVL